MVPGLTRSFTRSNITGTTPQALLHHSTWFQSTAERMSRHVQLIISCMNVCQRKICVHTHTHTPMWGSIFSLSIAANAWRSQHPAQKWHSVSLSLPEQKQPKTQKVFQTTTCYREIFYKWSLCCDSAAAVNSMRCNLHQWRLLFVLKICLVAKEQ